MRLNSPTKLENIYQNYTLENFENFIDFIKHFFLLLFINLEKLYITLIYYIEIIFLFLTIRGNILLEETVTLETYK